MTTGLILLHGLPETPHPENSDEDPFLQFLPLRPVLETPVAPELMIEYPWWRLFEGKRMNATVYALTGRLAMAVAPELDAEIQACREKHPEVDQWGLGGYSAGGWIIYQWLTLTASPAQQDVTFAFTIGAPFQNLIGFLFLQGEQVNCKTWKLARRPEDTKRDPGDVLCSRLAPGRLHSIFSCADTTVWPVNAEFDQETYVQPGVVSQTTLDAGDLTLRHDVHQALCSRPETAQSLGNWLRQVVQ